MNSDKVVNKPTYKVNHNNIINGTNKQKLPTRPSIPKTSYASINIINGTNKQKKLPTRPSIPTTSYASIKKDEKHKIVPTTVQQPPVKRARGMPLSTTVEENIEAREDSLTDDPMLEQQQQQQQTQVTAEKSMYTIIDKTELNGDVLLTLKLKSPTAATENRVSQQSQPYVFANLFDEPQQQVHRDQPPQHMMYVPNSQKSLD
jgi:hypothetical protein